MPNLGQTQYYKVTQNGEVHYTSLPWGGNAPYGYTPISKTEYISGLTQQVADTKKLQADIIEANQKWKPGINADNLQNYASSLNSPDWYKAYLNSLNPNLSTEERNRAAGMMPYFQGTLPTNQQINDLQLKLSEVSNGQGIHASNYVDPSFSKFQPNAPTPSEQYYTPEYRATLAPREQARLNALYGQSNPISVLPSGKSEVQIGNTFGIANSSVPPPTPNTQTLGDVIGGNNQVNQSNMQGGFPNSNLQPGMSGEGVKQLQQWLISQGYQIPAGATGYYGEQTRAAVAQLQKNLGVDNSTGVGYWGPRTISAISQKGGQGGQGGGTPPAGGSGGPLSISDQLDGPFKQLYDTTKAFLDELQSRGQVVNANVEITPERVAEFMRHAEGSLEAFMPYAEKEIVPYYQKQLQLAREGFLSSLGYTRDELLRVEQDAERKFQKNFVGIGESAADRGFALSGIRQKEEKDLVQQTQRDLEANRRKVAFGASDAARQFAQKYGTANIPSMSISGTPGVGYEGFEKRQDQPLYELSPETYAGLVGSEEYNQKAAIKSRASELESAFRSQSALDQERRLVI